MRAAVDGSVNTEGFTTTADFERGAGYVWVCDACFSDFGEEFGRSVESKRVEPNVSSVLGQDEFLVAYDYGTGGLWGVLIAPSVESIRAKFPELQVADTIPSWMDDEMLIDIGGHRSRSTTIHRRAFWPWW